MNNSSLVPPPTASEGNLLFLFSAVNLLGVVLNSLVIAVVLRHKVIPGKIPRVFLLNQLISEWICSFFEGFTWLIDRDWPVPDNGWGTLACKLVYNRALYYSVQNAIMTNLVLLMVERYVSVVHPLKHGKFTPTLNAIVIFLSWSTGFVRSTYRYLEPQRSGNACVLVQLDTRIQSLVIVLWTLYIPVTVIAVLNGRIIHVLRRQRKLIRPLPGNVVTQASVPRDGALRTKLERQLTYSVCIICLYATLVCSPLAIVYLLMSFNIMTKDLKSPLAQGLTHLASTFFAISPAVCIFQMQTIRKEILTMLRCSHFEARAAELQTRRTNVSAITNTTSPEEQSWPRAWTTDREIELERKEGTAWADNWQNGTATRKANGSNGTSDDDMHQGMKTSGLNI